MSWRWEVERDVRLSCVSLSVSDISIAFWIPDGSLTTILPTGISHFSFDENPSIVAKCLEWGVDYQPKQETA